jgi:hypothetical protein
VKALIGLAVTAIALIAAGGLKVAIPDSPATEGPGSRVRVTAVVDGDTLRVEDLTGRALGRVRLLGSTRPKSPTLRRRPSATPRRPPACSSNWPRSAARSSSSPTAPSPTATGTTGCCATSTTATST